MKKSRLEELVGFNADAHMKKFKGEFLELLTKYGLALRPDYTMHIDRGIITTEFEVISTHDDMLKAFIKQSEERTRIYAEHCHEKYADKPWYKYCCKCCKYRFNHPIAGAVCLAIEDAENHCCLVKKWIETRK
jgi:hypothetical protein